MSKISKTFLKSLIRLNGFKFKYYKFVFFLTETRSISDNVVRPLNSICIAADILKHYMERLGYALCSGNIYKKISESQFTYVYCCGVKDFLDSLGDAVVANAIASHITTLESFLSSKACRVIEPIKIDYNMIECLPAGYCFRISLKKFVKVVKFPADTTPRTFIR